MSYMKRHFEDTVCKEEEIAGMMIEFISDEDFAKINKLCGDKMDAMYDYWIETHGREVSRQWLREHGDFLIDYEDIAALGKHMFKEFIKSLESYN